MAIDPNVKILRAKKLGVLIRDARLYSHRSLSDCADVLGVSQETFEAYELGDQPPSLPELELLSLYFGISLEHFYENKLLADERRLKDQLDPQVLLGLRQRMVGAVIRKYRKEAGLSLENLAEIAGLAPEMLESYELGLQPVPVPDLDTIAFGLGCTVKDFQDQHGPVGIWFAQQAALKGFEGLSPEMQVFISKPVNKPYLEMAQRLSELSVEKLRMVAEALLEITL